MACNRWHHSTQRLFVEEGIVITIKVKIEITIKMKIVITI